jgi:hypothetical protein
MAVFRFDTVEGQIYPKRCEGNITGPGQRYPSVKKSLAGRFGRPRPSREVATQNTNAGTEGTSGGYRHLRFFLSYFEYTMYFGTTIQYYTLTQ